MLFIHGMYRGTGSSNVSVLSPENSFVFVINFDLSVHCIHVSYVIFASIKTCISNLGRTVRLWFNFY